MSEKMVEVWFPPEEFKKFINNEKCYGYPTSAIKLKIAPNGSSCNRCLVSIDEIDKVNTTQDIITVDGFDF